MRRIAMIAAFIILAPLARAADANWPMFRGAEALGIADDDPRLPSTWSQTENVAWKTAVRGTGWSSPVVWGDKVFLTSVVNTADGEPPKKGLYFGGNRLKPPESEHVWVVTCIDLNSGKVLWEKEAARGVPTFPRHLKNSYASETPAVDAERVYAYFGSMGLFVFDHDGNAQWTKELQPAKTRFGWGTAASPIIHKGKVYIVNDNDDQSTLTAYDAKSGETLWERDRDEHSNWATPYVWENELRTEIVTPGSDMTRSYDLEGNLLWEFAGMSTITIAVPFTKFGLLYISSGYIGDDYRPVYAIRPGASGDITLKDGEDSNEYIAWHDAKAAPYNPTPIIHGDYYYVLFDRGFFACLDARTGKEVYGKQRLGAPGFTSSPWAYNGKIFCQSEDGDTVVIKAGPEFEILGKNSLDEMCMATPAIVRGNLLIRTSGHLYCMREGASSGG